MYGPEVEAGTPLEEAIKAFPDELLKTKNGVVDYVIGASPGPGVFIIGRHDDPKQQHYLKLYKMGDGPYYCFYRPFHLCHFELPNTVARAALFDDAVISPVAAPEVEVVAVAKKDLRQGEKLDGVGHYMTYGVCENADDVASEKMLPLGIAEGCMLIRDVDKDQVLTYEDVKVPEGRYIDQLRQKQIDYFKANEIDSREQRTIWKNDLVGASHSL
jgi:predicted homoserine dehydrogenase-like protein